MWKKKENGTVENMFIIQGPMANRKCTNNSNNRTRERQTDGERKREKEKAV